MKEWRDDIFNNFIKLNRGFDLPEKDIIEGAHPVVASTTIKAYHKDYKVLPPAVVTGRSGSLGVVQYIQQNCWPLNTSLYVKDFKGNFPKYVYYFLKTLHLENFNSGAGVPSLNQNHLHKLRIKIPPLPIQRKIAAVLSAYDDLIENNNRRIAILEKMAEELYREWFVRLRFPGHEKVRIVKGVPEGWEAKRIGDVYDIQYGKNLPTEFIKAEGKYPVYGAGGILGFYTEKNTDNLVTLITCRGNGSGTVWRTKVKETFITNNSFKIKTRFIDENDMYFSFYHLNHSAVEQAISGSAQPQITIDGLSKVKTILPKKGLIELFIAKTKPFFEQIDGYSIQNSILTTSRDMLLSRLMSGKLDVERLDIKFPPLMMEESVNA